MSEKYNGWTNYETWRVNLEVFDGVTIEELTGHRLLTFSELKDTLREYAEELIFEGSSEGLARDYAFAFLQSVDWWEIANNMLADCEAKAAE
jgi:hypothetical protein